LRLLEARPEWRAELRRLLIPDELLELPAVVRQLAEDIRHLQHSSSALIMLSPPLKP